MNRSVVLLLAGCLFAACSQSYSGGTTAASPETTPPPPAALDPVGTFDLHTEAMGTAVSGTFTITGSPGSYRGTMTSNIGGFSLSDICGGWARIDFLRRFAGRARGFCARVQRQLVHGELGRRGDVGSGIRQ